MPLYYLLALFIGVPLVELAILIKLHERIGLGSTILLVILTGVVGTVLVRRQGINILFKIQRKLQEGNLPAPQMLDGIMILVAGALLITPGLITDVVGFTLLVPAARERIRFWLKNKLEEKIRSSYVQVDIDGSGGF